jgi:hypothetical protein
MKNGQDDEPGQSRKVKLPAIGTIRAEDLNPVLADRIRAMISKAFEGEELEPIASSDTLNVPVMDLIQAYRWLAWEFQEMIDGLDIPPAHKSRFLGRTIGQLYRLEQELLARLGLVTD